MADGREHIKLMRIGLFTDAYLPQIGGVSTSTALLQRALKEMGHQAFVITPNDPDASPDEIDVLRVPSLPFVSAKRLSSGIHPIMSRKLKSLSLDIVHSQTEFGMGGFARSIARQLDIPHVHTFHTLYEDWLNDQVKAKEGGIYRKLTRFYVQRQSRYFCNRTDEVICPTEKTREVLLNYGVTKPITVVPTGIELSAFREAAQEKGAGKEIRSRLGIPADGRILLYLGRISNEKHIDELLYYLKTSLLTRPDVHFVLVGDGPAREALTKEAKESDIAAQVHFVGKVSWSVVMRYYAAADFFLSASQSETQGLTYIEALAAGVPILVRQDPCLDEVVHHGENGFYFIDEASFNEGLDALLSLDRDGYEKISEVATRSVDKYSVESFAGTIVSIYRRHVNRALDRKRLSGKVILED